jgi:CRP-like cAMP-binding protein
MVQVKAGHVFFSQGGLADAIFFLDSGRAKLTVVSARGKEATVTMLAPGDFIGEESLAGGAEVHDASATAVTPCKALKLSRKEMVLLLHEQHEFSDIFLKFVLLEESGLGKTSSTSCSTTARSASHAHCSSWLSSANRESRRA